MGKIEAPTPISIRDFWVFLMDRAWQRRRSPDDVPTPVAVAVSDFCRRSGYTASPAEVREALSLLAEEEDFRVRALTDGEPEGQGLSPMAVVDVLAGSAQALAAARQACGYYGLARQLVAEREHALPAAAAAPPLAPALPAAVTAWNPAAAAPAPVPGKPGKKPKQTMQERIAPKKRTGPSPAFSEELPPLGPPSTREDARPKGRYSVVAPVRESVEALFEGSGKALLAPAVEQHPDRFALTRALGDTFGGRKEGQPLRTEDLERALHHHGLLDRLERKEREAVLGAYTEERGASRRAANALNLSLSELNRLARSLGIEQEVEAVRERFRREALSPRRLGSRLDLLGREKYLQDLGIRRRFDDQLREDLRKLLRAHAAASRSGREVILLAARMEGASAELLWRSVEKLGLTSEVKALFPDDPDSNYAP
jgi:hypothetical protein